VTRFPKCEPRSADPLDQHLADRLNAWTEESTADSRQSLARAVAELACWTLGAVLVAVATVVWLV
jgi:hypothetical protein